MPFWNILRPKTTDRLQGCPEGQGLTDPGRNRAEGPDRSRVQAHSILPAPDELESSYVY